MLGSYPAIDPVGSSILRAGSGRVGHPTSSRQSSSSSNLTGYVIGLFEQGNAPGAEKGCSLVEIDQNLEPSLDIL